MLDNMLYYIIAEDIVENAFVQTLSLESLKGMNEDNQMVFECNDGFVKTMLREKLMGGL